MFIPAGTFISHSRVVKFCPIFKFFSLRKLVKIVKSQKPPGHAPVAPPIPPGLIPRVSEGAQYVNCTANILAVVSVTVKLWKSLEITFVEILRFFE